jgi:hypothetical protein
MGPSPEILEVETQLHPCADQEVNILDIFCDETNTWVPETWLSRASAKEVESWSQNVSILETPYGWSTCHLFSEIAFSGDN